MVLANTSAVEWCEIVQPTDVVVGTCYNLIKKLFKIVLLDAKTLQKTQTVYRYSIDRIRYFRIAQQSSVVYMIDTEENQLIVCSLLDDKLQISNFSNGKPGHGVRPP